MVERGGKMETHCNGKVFVLKEKHFKEINAVDKYYTRHCFTNQESVKCTI